MNSFRTPNIDGTRIVVPIPINVSELVDQKEFRGSLIHFTTEQWELTLKQFELVKRLPKDAVSIKAMELQGGSGVIANPFHRCPPGCDPIYGRGEVCQDIQGVVDIDHTPRPDCWFEPQCDCHGSIDDRQPPISSRSGSSGCDHTDCQLRLMPLQIKGGLTMMKLTCVKIKGQCKQCQLAATRSSQGVYLLGCICKEC